MSNNVTALIQEITQAVLAVLTLAGSVVVAILLIQHGGTGDVPAWLALGVGAVLGFYFGARTAAPTITALTNGPMHLLAAATQRSPNGRSTDPPSIEPPT